MSADGWVGEGGSDGNGMCAVGSKVCVSAFLFSSLLLLILTAPCRRLLWIRRHLDAFNFDAQQNWDERERRTREGSSTGLRQVSLFFLTSLLCSSSLRHLGGLGRLRLECAAEMRQEGTSPKEGGSMRGPQRRYVLSLHGLLVLASSYRHCFGYASIKWKDPEQVL